MFSVWCSLLVVFNAIMMMRDEGIFNMPNADNKNNNAEQADQHHADLVSPKYPEN